ncbi:GNAT family N-acetyltransferase [Streptomyces albireticuli]|uniref:GNAT family N-acetyltransferase n=1 Tax=Streptomyces albireticuli TaxID=1940 RepID=A0A2A2DAS9_9ACTN|nr:GNAT family N-acetyltransferase [Streptomyces albireticuli]
MNHPGVHLTRPARAADWHLIDAFHRNCSPENLLRRWSRTRITRRHAESLLEHSSCWISLDSAGCPLALTSTGWISQESGVIDLALQVADAHQGRGIGTALARHVADHAHRRGAHTLTVHTDAANTPMLRLLRHLGPSRHVRDGTRIDVRVPLGAAP